MEVSPAEKKGVYELLWDIFGGITNEKGYKVLDTHIRSSMGTASLSNVRKKSIADLKQKVLQPQISFWELALIPINIAPVIASASL